MYLENTNLGFGLNDQDHEGQFVNTDGCPQNFLMWQDRQPDNYANEDCVQLSSRSGWNDISCTQRLRMVCKRSDSRLRGPCGEFLFGK